MGHTIVKTKGYSTTMALSTLRKLLGSQYLRRGDGIVSTVNTRRAERLFGLKGSGHVKKGLVGAVKLEKLRGDGYNPADDTCVKAFVRLSSAHAQSLKE